MEETHNQQRLESDPEIQVLTQLRLALSSMLHMLEHVRDDLLIMGNRMDRLTHASEQYRQSLLMKQYQQTSNDDPTNNNNDDDDDDDDDIFLEENRNHTESPIIQK